eukprot:3936889-Rhodomonas_salina.1
MQYGACAEAPEGGRHRRSRAKRSLVVLVGFAACIVIAVQCAQHASGEIAALQMDNVPMPPTLEPTKPAAR